LLLSCFVLHHGMPDTSVGEMASDGSFAVNYTGTGFAPWFGF